MEAVTGATSSLLPKLGALLQEEYKLQHKVRRDIQSLQNELLFMNATLLMVAEEPADKINPLLRTWATLIRELSYDMEDVVNIFMAEVHGNSTTRLHLGGLREKAFNMLCMCTTHHRLADMIEEMKSLTKELTELRARYRLDDIRTMGVHPQPQRDEYPFTGFLNRTSSSSGAGAPRADSYGIAAEDLMVSRQLIRTENPAGVKPDMEKLRGWLEKDDKDSDRAAVLSIIGYGGVGKTTIATALYQDLGYQFDCWASVTVSQNYRSDEVLSDILRQIKQQGSRSSSIHWTQIETMGHDQLVRELKTTLTEKRYLLLIDDVWSTSTWHNIRRYFPQNDKGSRIIVTTRFQAVATACHNGEDADYLYPIKVLSNQESEKLFKESLLECKRTAANQQSENNVPERVWGMCGGLPLAIVTMAGLVASKPLSTETEWTKVCERLFPEPEKCHKPDDFMRIIKYCYSELPSDLKTCSLYLSIFPKGRRFSRKRLIRRWIAEGFVSEKQGLSVEDVAETFFTQLIERKIIRPVEHNSDGRVKSCQVHDMILEYIMSKAGEEDFVTVIGGYWSTPTHSNKIRRLSLHSSDSGQAKKADSMNLSHVRSLTVFGSLDQLRFKSLKTRIVQVLDLEGCRGFKAGNVSDICEMTLLKYLSLRATDISKLPSNIGNLKYLETLDVRQTEIEELPKSVGQLERINNILGGDKRTRKTLKLPKDFKGIMKGLRILSGIEIVKDSTAATDLRHFTRLRKLAIYKVHKDGQMFNDLLSSILYLSDYSLQSLILDDESSDFLNTPSKGPEETSHPWDLRTLELSGKLPTIPKWLPRLSELIKLTLSATALRTDNLALLSKLHSLFSLTFSISAANKDPDMAAILEQNKSDSRGDIFVPAGGFVKLKLLRIFVPLLPSLNFSDKGTPLLERLELRFKRLEGVHGMDNLKKLHDVILTVDDEADELTKTMVDDLKKSSSSNTSSKKYTLIVNEYHG